MFSLGIFKIFLRALLIGISFRVLNSGLYREKMTSKFCVKIKAKSLVTFYHFQCPNTKGIAVGALVRKVHQKMALDLHT